MNPPKNEFELGMSSSKPVDVLLRDLAAEISSSNEGRVERGLSFDERRDSEVERLERRLL